MATLREYFFTDFDTLSAHFDFSVRAADGGPVITVVARVHADFKSYTRYVSYFMPEGLYDPMVAAYLSQHPGSAIKKADSTVSVTSGHAAVYGSLTDSSKLPFSGRVFLYVDQIVPDVEKEGLIGAAAGAGIHFEIRDRAYSDFLTVHEKPWAFISHDSRDKDPFVRQLAAKLRSMMCPVWYDEYSLKVGQSLRESIDRGLNEAPKCILVLSSNFLSNPGWTKAEFNAVMGKHISSGGSVILPIWHNVSKAEVEAYSLLVTDIVALKSEMDMDDLVRKLFVEINPSS